jgi:redox-sensitive bicupin YhaK (pirin superfamily)
MHIIQHPASTRGGADHGWLKARHSFSFGGWHDPSRIHFGMLRVLNDDLVAPGAGFGKHPHDNMEIITIPLTGALKHQDSTGGEGVIKPGEVQVMSAGTGVFHSEMNASGNEAVTLFQIWIIPNRRNVEPRYDQRTFSEDDRVGKWQTLISPMDTDDEGIKIHQDAWISRATITDGGTLEYAMHRKGNGVYLMLVEGALTIADKTMWRRDALGITGTDRIEIKATDPSDVLVIEVPMQPQP